MYKTIRQITNDAMPLVRVECYLEDFAGQQADFVFWVPYTSLDEGGWVPSNIIRARIKHHTGVHQGHFNFHAG